MITLDAIRTAVLSERPYAQLDALVRAEIAAGRKVNDIFEALHPLTDDVLDTPSLREDGEEAFLGTLDKLTGMCHPDCRYADPPAAASDTSPSPWTPTAGPGLPLTDDVRG